MNNLEAIVTRHPFWQGLPAGYFPALTAGAALVRFAPGEVIATEGQETTRFYLILHGKVCLEAQVPDEGPVTIQTIGPGEALGWSWLLPPFLWHFTARADQATEALAWDSAQLRALAAADPAFGYQVACRMTQVLSQRLQAAHNQLVEFHASAD